MWNPPQLLELRLPHAPTEKEIIRHCPWLLDDLRAARAAAGGGAPGGLELSVSYRAGKKEILNTAVSAE